MLFRSVKQSLVDSEARKALQADLDEATISLNEVNESTLFLSNKLDSTTSWIFAIKEEKEVLSAALAEQNKTTVEVQRNMVEAQHLIKRLGLERENFEIRSKKLEEELKECESLLKTRAEELDRHATEMGKAVDNSTLPQSQHPNPTATTYVASIKTLVPITLDLQDSNYAKWRELFLATIGRYGLTSHVLGIGRAHV